MIDQASIIQLHMNFIFVCCIITMHLFVHHAGPPDPPDNVMISFNQTNLLVTWTPSDSIPPCVTGYMVDTNATSSTLISTTETSISLPLAGRSLTTYYCVRVASIDTGGRIGAFSQKECFQLEG